MASGRLLFMAPGDVRKARVEPISWMRTCDAFARRGFSVTLVGLRSRLPDAVSLDDLWEHFGVPPSFRVRLLPTTLGRTASATAFRFWGGLLAAAVAMWVVIRAAIEKQDTIVYARAPLLLAPFAALRLLVPVGRRPRLIYETHALPPRSAWRVVRRADLVVVNSDKLRRELANEADVPPEKILHAPLPPYAHVRPITQASARTLLGLPDHEAIACYTGKMVRSQCEFLLQLSGRVAKEVPSFRLLLVGGNPEVNGWIQARVAEMGLERAVLATGFVEPGLAPVYQAAADVLILQMDPALEHYEYCTPAKAYDYQALGRPIVAQGIPLFAEVFGEDGERAVRVRELSVPAFSDAVVQALGAPEAMTAMGERARRWMDGRTWQARVDATLEALSSAP